MACKVNWGRFYTRQKLLQRKLATKCGCDACKKLLHAINEAERVLEVGKKNKNTPR